VLDTVEVDRLERLANLLGEKLVASGSKRLRLAQGVDSLAGQVDQVARVHTQVDDGPLRHGPRGNLVIQRKRGIGVPGLRNRIHRQVGPRLS
jgi:hypothetical protein